MDIRCLGRKNVSARCNTAWAYRRSCCCGTRVQRAKFGGGVHARRHAYPIRVPCSRSHWIGNLYSVQTYSKQQVRGRHEVAVMRGCESNRPRGPTGGLILVRVLKGHERMESILPSSSLLLRSLAIGMGLPPSVSENPERRRFRTGPYRGEKERTGGRGRGIMMVEPALLLICVIVVRLPTRTSTYGGSI
jgi:hypothetical protein